MKQFTQLSGSLAVLLGAALTCLAAGPSGSPPASAPAPGADKTEILGFRVASEGPDTLVLDVDYQYSGERGPVVFASAYFAIDGEVLRSYAVKPGTVRSGHGTTQIVLRCMQLPLMTNQLQFTFYRSDAFYEVFFPYQKTWSRPDTAGGSTATSVTRGPTTRSVVASRPSRAASSAPSLVARRSTSTTRSSASNPAASPSRVAGRSAATVPTAASARRPAPSTRMTPSPFVRWAIIATPEVQKWGVPDLLTAELSKQSEIKLVERAQIEAVAKEQAVSGLLGSDAAAGRLKLGRLLKADALILLAEETTGQEKVEAVRVVISETTYGARLGLDCLPRGNKMEDIAARVAAVGNEVIARYPSGLRWIIAVPPFVAKNVSDEFDPLRSRFAHVLESALAGYPGTAVLEIEEAQAIRKEQALTGGDATSRVVPAVVEGEFRIERAAGRESLKLGLRVTRGAGPETLAWELPGIEQTVRLLRTEAPVRIMHVSSEEFQKVLSVETQVSILADRADVFARRGEYLPSTSLREAALLVDPDNAEQNVALVRDYMAVVPYGEMVNWGAIPQDVLGENFRQRAALWRRGVEVLEHVVRNRLAHRSIAVSLADHARRSLDGLIFFVDGLAGAARAHPDDSVPPPLRQEGDECARVYSRFVREVVPLLGGLEPLPSRHDPGKPVDRYLLDLAINLDYEGTAAWPQRVLTKADLDHYAHVLIDLVPDDPFASSFILGLLWKMGTDPDHPRSFTDEEYLGFLTRLGQSAQQMNRFYSRLGFLLHDRLYGRGGRKIGDGEALQALDAIERDLAAYLRVRSGKVRELASIRKAITPLGSRAGPLPPLPARVMTIEPSTTNDVDLEPISVVLRSRSGGSLQFAEIGDWYSIGGELRCPVAAGAADVFWNSWTLWVHREPGVLQEIFFQDKEARWFHDVTWDGQNIWTITASNGVGVYSLTGQLIARAGSEEGLPPANIGARLAALSPGKIVAAGSLGVRNRAWCATLSLQGGSIKVDVFHEAALAQARAEQERIKEGDPRVAFVPYWLYSMPASPSPRDAEPRLLLSCAKGTEVLAATGVRDAYALWLFPDRRTAERADFELAGNDNKATRHLYYFLPNGDCLFAYGPSVRAWTAPGNRKGGEPVVRTLYSNKRREFYGQMFLYDGKVYAPGEQWVRVDPHSLAVEPLGLGATPDVWRRSELCYGVSRHFGLVAWDWARRSFYRVRVHRRAEASPGADDGKLAQFDREITASPHDEAPRRGKVSCLFLAGRLEEARSACLYWIDVFPQSAEARCALIDTLRKLRSGLDVHDDTDDAWAKYPHPTLGSWLLFDSSGSDTFGKAIHLPFAADKAEWLVAEFCVLEAAQWRYRRARYRGCIDVCDAWEAAGKSYEGRKDASYLALRAAARLRLGEFKGAEADAEAAVKQEAAGELWTAHAPALLQAVRAKDREYEYRGNDPQVSHHWLLGTR